MLYLTVLLFSLQCVFYINTGYIKNKLFDNKIFHATRMDGICRGKNVPTEAFFKGVKFDSLSIFIHNCTLIEKEDFDGELKLTITITRCRSKENLDSCEQFLEQPNIDFCKTINPNNVLISKSPFVIPFEPPVKCPIRKGIHHAYNFSFDVAPFVFFNPEGWYWKAEGELFSFRPTKLRFCLHLEAYVTSR